MKRAQDSVAQRELLDSREGVRDKITLIGKVIMVNNALFTGR